MSIQWMLDSLKDCYNWFLPSLVKKYLNEHIIYYNFSFLIEKSFQACQVITQSYLLIAFEFIFILKHIFCLPKMPQ